MTVKTGQLGQERWGARFLGQDSRDRYENAGKGQLGQDSQDSTAWKAMKPELVTLNRSACSGHTRECRSAETGQPLPVILAVQPTGHRRLVSWVRSVRIGQPGQDIRDGIAEKEQSLLETWDRLAETHQPRQVSLFRTYGVRDQPRQVSLYRSSWQASLDRTHGTGQPGQINAIG
jgi:hypothetical protein